MSSASRLVLFLQGEAYDVTEFRHPGGHGVLVPFQHRDATQAFLAQHHYINFRHALRRFHVGSEHEWRQREDCPPPPPPAAAAAAARRTRLPCAALHAHCRHGRVAAVRALLAAGDVSRADLAAFDARGNTALILACQQGHIDLARLLIEAGADVNATTKSRVSAPLDFARRFAYKDLEALLLEHGARGQDP